MNGKRSRIPPDFQSPGGSLFSHPLPIPRGPQRPRARLNVFVYWGGKRSKVSPRGVLNLPAARFLQTKRFDPLPFRLPSGKPQVSVLSYVSVLPYVHSPYSLDPHLLGLTKTPGEASGFPSLGSPQASLRFPKPAPLRQASGFPRCIRQPQEVWIKGVWRMNV